MAIGTVGIHHLADAVIADRHKALDIASVFFQYRLVVVQDIDHIRVLKGFGVCVEHPFPGGREGEERSLFGQS